MFPEAESNSVTHCGVRIQTIRVQHTLWLVGVYKVLLFPVG